MATALRHAARRFGTRAAAEAEAVIERSPMYNTTRIVNSTTGHDLTPDQKKAAVSHLARIQATKEDLHDMITAWDASYSAPDYFAYGSVVPRKNKRLLKELSQHVSPRRDDPRWRSCRRAMYFNDLFKFAGAVLMGKMVGDALSQYEGK